LVGEGLMEKPFLLQEHGEARVSITSVMVCVLKRLLSYLPWVLTGSSPYICS
jgi:hypothetical protein